MARRDDRCDPPVLTPPDLATEHYREGVDLPLSTSPGAPTRLHAIRAKPVRARIAAAALVGRYGSVETLSLLCHVLKTGRGAC